MKIILIIWCSDALVEFHFLSSSRKEKNVDIKGVVNVKSCSYKGVHACAYTHIHICTRVSPSPDGFKQKWEWALHQSLILLYLH